MFLTSDMTPTNLPTICFAAGSIGLEGDSPDNIPSYLALLDAGGKLAKAELVPMQALGEPTEYSPIPTLISSDAGGNISISTNCANPVEVVVKAMDYLFTDEGAILSSYGIEGLTYEINDEGKPEFTRILFPITPTEFPSVRRLVTSAIPVCQVTSTMPGTGVSWDDVQKSAFDVLRTPPIPDPLRPWISMRWR